MFTYASPSFFFHLLLVYATFQWTNEFTLVSISTFLCRISESKFTMVNIIVQEIKHLVSSEGRMLISNIHVRLISEVLMTSSLQHRI